MIGSDGALAPNQIQIKRKPLSNSLGVQSPTLVSDGTVQDAKNNVIAQGYRTPRVQARRGFSNSKFTGAAQGIQDANALGQAASSAAGLEAEAQAYNAQMSDQYDQMRDQALTQRRSHDASIHDALTQKRQREQGYDQQLRLDNEAQRDRLKYSLLGRMI